MQAKPKRKGCSPGPVNFAGDKRVFVADMFYDVSHPVRRALHRNYIRLCLRPCRINTLFDIMQKENDTFIYTVMHTYSGIVPRG